MTSMGKSKMHNYRRRKREKARSFSVHVESKSVKQLGIYDLPGGGLMDPRAAFE